MANHFENRVVRPVRLYTERLTLDGLLNVSLGARTLDELNAASRPMVSLSSPLIVSGEWTLGEGPILVTKNSILMATEIPDLGATLGSMEIDPELRRFGRTVIRLRVGGYSIDAYVHSSHGSDPLVRLTQATHPFIALNAATVSGARADFVVPFLAVNRSHVLAAQELYSVSAVPEEVAAGPGESAP